MGKVISLIRVEGEAKLTLVRPKMIAHQVRVSGEVNRLERELAEALLALALTLLTGRHPTAAELRSDPVLPIGHAAGEPKEEGAKVDNRPIPPTANWRGGNEAAVSFPVQDAPLMKEYARDTAAPDSEPAPAVEPVLVEALRSERPSWSRSAEALNKARMKVP
eukprot:CAMPEP_0183326158 /NCGR_PEP_ID=MMETSP0160_2-20130417/81473_1 /TAXON_ID=2839 ORGANISM="Odontella Sinensis, Strain Grunow 1884" /NCGR_SAMPLE_ID=MMETSP0160_2 /ASSEMBLY_ACC=CAM_ASM_000250 /LENGTH=162 /DNA_ID=CAMNT_0025494087 /DNA_START=593 /DNA_END=1082 /DNA_ORIENTATION=+